MKKLGFGLGNDMIDEGFQARLIGEHMEGNWFSFEL
jgi:hypothetical protein